MWSSIVTPQRHSFMPEKQQHREYGIFIPAALPIATGKSFRNPNFVNGLNQHGRAVKPIDNSIQSYQKSCHTQIIDSIKEKCPEIIPSAEKDSKTISGVSAESTQASPIMCPSKNYKSFKRVNTQKGKRQLGKNSKQNRKRQDIKEMLQENQEILKNSTEICSSPRSHTLHLQDFIMRKPSPNICSPAKTMVQSLEILITNGERVPTFSEAAIPSPSHQCSFSDSEDSFIIFDNHRNEEHPTDDDEDENSFSRDSFCSRLRKLSVCDSEESFIVFENDDMSQDDYKSDQESDDCSGSSDEEVDQERDCYNDWHNESNFDQTESSILMVQPKKVRFAAGHKLCEVRPMIKWSYAYQAARKGPWEMYARDRCRFKERAFRAEREIGHVFDPRHREKIYKERFENL